MENAKHGNPKQHDNHFDSDLCGCGCTALHTYLTTAEIATLVRNCKEEDKPLTDARALSHARAVNARADFSIKEAA